MAEEYPKHKGKICSGAHCRCMNIGNACPNFHHGDHICPHDPKTFSNTIEGSPVLTPEYIRSSVLPEEIKDFMVNNLPWKNPIQESLQDILKKEVGVIYDMVQIMHPKGKDEFIAVALPNLHTNIFHLLEKPKMQSRDELKQLFLLIMNVLAEKWDKVESQDPDQSTEKWKGYKRIRNNERAWIMEVAKSKGIEIIN